MDLIVKIKSTNNKEYLNIGRKIPDGPRSRARNIRDTHSRWCTRVIRLTVSTHVFYPNENNGRDRYEAPGNWRRRLMKTKRERRQQEWGR